MGLLKAGTARPTAIETPSDRADLTTLLAELEAPDASVRRGAARALGGHKVAVPELAAALDREVERPVQQALIGALIEIAIPAAVAALVALLRSEQAWLRNASLEALQAIGPAAMAAVRAQLSDPVPCARISAVVTLSGLPAGEAEAWLIAMVEDETEVNVLAAIIEALDQVGGPAALPVLDQFIQGKGADPFLAFAAGAVRARLASGAK